MRARLMAVGGFLLGLGYALVIGSSNIANLVYGANSVGGGAPISTGDAFSISFWLLWAGLVLLPVGVAVLIYGVAAKSPPAAVFRKEGGTDAQEEEGPKESEAN